MTYAKKYEKLSKSVKIMIKILFRPISRFISEMMQDRVIVTMEGE